MQVYADPVITWSLQRQASLGELLSHSKPKVFWTALMLIPSPTTQDLMYLLALALDHCG